jgi:hypothetical protein
MKNEIRGEVKLNKVPKINVEQDWLTSCEIADMETCMESHLKEDSRRGEENAIILAYQAVEKEKQKRLRAQSAKILAEEVFEKLLNFSTDELVPKSIIIETDKLDIKITSK